MAYDNRREREVLSRSGSLGRNVEEGRLANIELSDDSIVLSVSYISDNEEIPRPGNENVKIYRHAKSTVEQNFKVLLGPEVFHNFDELEVSD